MTTAGRQASADGPPRRRLLLVANPFPPLASGGNARLLRFARFLPGSGWDVTVLTVRAEGPAPVPDGLRIERAAAPSPEAAYRVGRRAVAALRHLAVVGRGAPVGSPRHGAAADGHQADTPVDEPEAIFSAQVPAPPPPAASAKRRSSRRGAVNDWLFVPDEWVAWIAPAVLRGRRLLRHERYDAVMSSFPRPSAELVASILARESRLPYVADYRDPWASRHLRRYPTRLHRSAHYALEEWAVRPAALVTTTAEPIAATLRVRFPQLADRVTVLPNGYDPPAPLEADTRPPDLGEGFWLVHTGRLYGRSEQLRRMMQAFAGLPGDVRWLFVGIDGREVRRQAEALGVSHRVRTVPFVPHHEALAYQRAADGLVLITGDAPEALSSKIFEYLAAGRPIFAFIPERSAAHGLLSATGGALVAPQDQPPDRALSAFVERARSGTLPPPEKSAVEQYDGRRLTRRLAELLDRVVDERSRACAHVTQREGRR